MSTMNKIHRSGCQDCEHDSWSQMATKGPLYMKFSNFFQYLVQFDLMWVQSLKWNSLLLYIYLWLSHEGFVCQNLAVYSSLNLHTCKDHLNCISKWKIMNFETAFCHLLYSHCIFYNNFYSLTHLILPIFNWKMRILSMQTHLQKHLQKWHVHVDISKLSKIFQKVPTFLKQKSAKVSQGNFVTNKKNIFLKWNVHLDISKLSKNFQKVPTFFKQNFAKHLEGNFVTNKTMRKQMRGISDRNNCSMVWDETEGSLHCVVHKRLYASLSRVEGDSKEKKSLLSKTGLFLSM